MTAPDTFPIGTTRSRGAWKGLVVGLFAALGIASCQSYNDRVAGAVEAYRGGNFELAEQRFKDESMTGSAFLSGAEAGMSAFSDGRFEDALLHFEAARRAAKDVGERAALGVTNLSESLLTLAINESQADYPGEGFERVMVHAMLGLCYLTRGQPDAVLVEARRVDDILTGEQDLYGSDYGAGGLGHFLSAMAYELVGKTDDAYIDYVRMHEKGLGGELVRRSLQRLARVGGRDEDLARWNEEFGSEGSEVPNIWPTVVVIAGVGMGPTKLETKISIPVSGAVFSWAVPRFDDGSGNISAVDLVFPETGTRIRSSVVEDVAAVAGENLEDRIAWIAARSAARGLLKRQLADQLKDNENGEVLGLIADAFTIFSERADLRAWRTLPRLWVAARAFVPPDEFVTIELAEVGGETVSLGRFRMLEGETMFVIARSTDGGLVAHVIGGEREKPSIPMPANPGPKTPDPE